MSDADIYLKKGTIVDATIIEVASLTKNKAKKRDPEIHQTQKGKRWFFGLKAYVGVDAKTRLTHNVSATTANIHDITKTANHLHSKECCVSANSDYRGAQKREELKQVTVDWLIYEILKG